MLALVGSRALAIVLERTVPEMADYDLIGTPEAIDQYIALSPVEAAYPLGPDKMLIRRNGETIEAEIAWSGSTGAEYLDLVSHHSGTTTAGFSAPCMIPPLDLLYALKLSHRFLKNSPHFRKTMDHIHDMRDQGAMLCGNNAMAWLLRREKATYDYGHPSLNRDKAAFFAGDGIDYVYDHDSIHEAMKHYHVPAYKMFQEDGAEVKSSQSKFETLPHDIKINAVLEETYVLALERSQIPYPKTHPRRSFDMALEKVCTSITSGWFRSFAWENYHEVRASYNPDYLDVFKMCLRDGIIKAV